MEVKLDYLASGMDELLRQRQATERPGTSDQITRGIPFPIKDVGSLLERDEKLKNDDALYAATVLTFRLIFSHFYVDLYIITFILGETFFLFVEIKCERHS